MATRHAWKFFSMALLILFVVPLNSTQIVDAKIDVVVLMLGEQEQNGKYSARKSTVLSWYFEFGEDKVRFAIVQSPYVTPDTKTLLVDKLVLTNLSNSKSLYEKTLRDYKVPPGVLETGTPGKGTRILWTNMTDLLIRKTVVNEPEQCDDVRPKPAKTKNCTNDKCECNKFWPRPRRDVCSDGEKCGQTLAARPGKAPQKMEHFQECIVCPPCAVTSGPDGSSITDGSSGPDGPGGEGRSPYTDGTVSTGPIIGGVLGGIAFLAFITGQKLSVALAAMAIASTMIGHCEAMPTTAPVPMPMPMPPAMITTLLVIAALILASTLCACCRGKNAEPPEDGLPPTEDQFTSEKTQTNQPSLPKHVAVKSVATSTEKKSGGSIEPVPMKPGGEASVATGLKTQGKELSKGPPMKKGPTGKS